MKWRIALSILIYMYNRGSSFFFLLVIPRLYSSLLLRNGPFLECMRVASVDVVSDCSASPVVA